MFTKIKKFIVVGITGLILAGPTLAPAVVGGAVYADPSSNAGSSVYTGLCQGINSAANGNNSGTGCDTSTGTANLTSVATKVINIFSIIVGIVAVIMIIVGGFRYVTSGGASDKVGGAKNTLIYAIIGLIIVALAQAIVHFVLNTTSTSVTG